MTGKVFGWKEKFDEGMRGEALFPSLYKGLPLTKHETREYDFDREDGKRVELKSDQYPIEKTENFFIERWSVFEQRKPGSFWQSIDKADIFIYFYAKSGVYFEFEDIPAVLQVIEAYIETEKPREMIIRNKNYSGMGYKIPRHVLCDFYKEVIL